MPDLWYRWFHRFCNAVYFHRVSVIHAERLPPAGPVLYLGLHRNGAVDGFVYHGVLPRAVFMLAAQLRRNAFGRLFFTGIEVVREKDRATDGADDPHNAGALQRCLDHLAAGRELFIMPEGTSTLGPRHLPFKSGAARLLSDHLATGRPITVVPLGIHYDCAWGFRSKVEVVVGPPIATDLPAEATAFERLKELRRRIQPALEAVGINVESAERLRTIEQLAYIATLGTSRSYFSALKSLERHIPPTVAHAWQSLDTECARRRLWRHQGIPLFPIRPPWLYVAAALLVTPVMLAALAVNAPPFLAAAWAGQNFPDDRNVTSLWRILVGVPAFLLWIAVVAVATSATGHALWFAGYAALTAVGLSRYRVAHKILVAAHNAVFHADLRPRALAFHRLVQEALPDA
ncbi:MAG: 1-acyl-sn-glycerol-3-phosphate acyltransferase [Verrucomicrobia bacterium]|nr:1-acyl-sn-glycerol-3-phosphate acyltransferase [Verrucomicrobiota bacterium]